MGHSGHLPQHEGKNRLFTIGGKIHPLKFKETDVEIFQDIPPEALGFRRKLKPITMQLQKASKQYRWSGPAKFQVQHNGSLLTAHNIESGLRLLGTPIGERLLGNSITI